MCFECWHTDDKNGYMGYNVDAPKFRRQTNRSSNQGKYLSLVRLIQLQLALDLYRQNCWSRKINAPNQRYLLQMLGTKMPIGIPEYPDYVQDMIFFQYTAILPDNGTLFECLKLVVIMWRMTLGKIGIIQQRHEINLLLLSKKNNWGNPSASLGSKDQWSPWRSSLLPWWLVDPPQDEVATNGHPELSALHCSEPK